MMDSAAHYWPSPLPAAASSPSSSRTPSPPVLGEHDILAVVHSKVNERVVDYIVERVVDTVAYGLGRPSSSKLLLVPEGQDTFPTFVHKVLRRAEVTMSVVIGALTYIERARSHLRIAVEEWALHRVFLGSLILAAKYLNDSSLKNAHWALCTRLFGKRDVARVEREFLDVLNWELAVKENDVAECCGRLVAAGCVDVKSRQVDMVMERDLAANVKERRGRSEERSSYRALQHRPQAPLPASRMSSRTLSNSAPALLMPVRGAPHIQQQRLPSPLSLPSSRSPSRSRPYEDESDDVDSPTSSVSSSSSASSASSDSASGDEAASSPFTPPHAHALALPYGAGAQQHPSALPKLVLPPHAAAKFTHRGQQQHKRSHAHARIAPYPSLSLSLPPTRTSSPAAAASAYAYAVPAPPVSSTSSGSMLLPPVSAKLMLPPPGTHGLYPSCIVGGPYAS
ncbi:hypothetical protein SCHPADRAFT_888947 [Schizopora paradoxa]|uniref:Cyclin N-terminal domain-containing protein n=1 Tax=Schizopora paradoxa TaxID=27342 RepID=A0A0H2RZN3_9AGAM|nr:hypothetical protein SCHPADRAFT_888947 [Schizopora paradoxa]